MEMVGLSCSGCGSTNIVFDPKARTVYCNQCGKREYYTRATINASGKVVHGKRNAINFFTQGRFRDARDFAMDVLNISLDNAPALFIISYCDEFVDHKYGKMKDFFTNIKEVPLEYEEIMDIRELIITAAPNIKEYEEDVIELVAKNMQDPSFKEDICELIDKVCPFWISKRTSIASFTPTLMGMYEELAGYCVIPKTCLALLKAIEMNPDSPYSGKGFYLKTKVQVFYDRFVVPVGKIIQSMNSESLRAKFSGAYKKIVQKYEADAKAV